MTKPTVYIVDDDQSVREALEALMNHVGWRTATFGSAGSFLSSVGSRAGDAPACLVLDVGLPDLSGLELQRRLRDARTRLPVIFLTGYGDVPMAVTAMKAGAVEVFTKPFRDDALLAAIDEAVERSREAIDHDSAVDAIRRDYAALSRREREVMTRVVAGRLNKQIAAELGISEITVKAHRGRVMRKMHADSVADLVRMAGRLDLPGAQ